MGDFTWTGSNSNSWSDAGNWTPSGGPPGGADNVTLFADGELPVVGGVSAAVDVFTEGFAPFGNPIAPTVTVDGGFTFAINGAGSAIDNGAIVVQTGATLDLDFNGAFTNQGTITIGKILSSNGSLLSSIGIDGAVTLNGGGTVNLGVTDLFDPETTAVIADSGPPSTLTNVNNTIEGAGAISVSQFDNQGTVEADHVGGFSLQINSPIFTNEGTLIAADATLDLGQDSQSRSLTNTGSIKIQAGGDLAISGNFTIAGGGAIIGKGAGGDITSDGVPATFTNESDIDYFDSGQIGDSGLFGNTNNLTFDDIGGRVLVSGNGHTLTLNTGNHTIGDTELGTFLAETGAQMVLDSPVTTGGNATFQLGHLGGGGGTIEALTGGTVTIAASVTPGGGSGLLFRTGQVLIQGGTVVMASGGTDTTPINFSGFGGVLQLNSAANTVGAIGGMGADDFVDLRYLVFAAGDHAVFNAGTLALLDGGNNMLASFMLAGSYTSANFTVASDGAGGTEIEGLNSPPSAGTTADMILREDGDGAYEIYDLGTNAILAAYPLTGVDPTWRVAGLGDFFGSDTSDMLLRNAATGAFQIEDIGNNNVTGTAAIGQVGLEWQVAGFGDFSSRSSETDMLMRNGNTGQFEIYDISNNAITSAAPMGQVGLEWLVAGFGDFSTRPGESDMLMRNSHTGAFELYDISNNQIISAAPMGQVGLEWSVAGFGDFSGNANETDMLMRNNNNGAFELYDIRNNTIASAAPMGQVGLEWQVAGFGPINGADISDMVMRNSTTGAFEIFDITNSQLTGAAPMGQVGAEWSVAGIAVDPPGGSAPANTQFTQAMASYPPSNGALNTDSPTDEAATQMSSSAMSAAPVPHANLI